MTTEERVKAALDVFGVPVEQNLLYAKASELPERYFTFSVDRSGADFADDEPGVEICSVTVHFFAPLNCNVNALVRETKKVLLKAGLTWPSTLNASDGDGQHYVFECQIPEGVDIDGEL